MKTLLFLALTYSVSAMATINPDHDHRPRHHYKSNAPIYVFEPDPEKKAAVEYILKKYEPKMIEKYTKAARVMWEDIDMINATANLIAGEPIVTFYKLLVNDFPVDEIALIACHEVGHFLGDIKMSQVGGWVWMFDFVIEGDADYFGGKCFAEYVKDQKKGKDLPINGLCSYHDTKDEQEYCSYALTKSNDMYNRLLQETLKAEDAKDLKVSKTLTYHPEGACRVLTVFNAITGQDRPTCWYKDPSTPDTAPNPELVYERAPIDLDWPSVD